MASTTESTREFVTDLFRRVRESGPFNKVVSEVMSEKIMWNATGSATISGIYHSKSEHREKIIDRLNGKLDVFPSPDVKCILADGEWATVWFRTNGAKAKNGVNFDMDYTWILRVQENEITELIGFFDGIKVQELFKE